VWRSNASAGPDILSLPGAGAGGSRFHLSLSRCDIGNVWFPQVVWRAVL
jgi:hypothetical protein